MTAQDDALRAALGTVCPVFTPGKVPSNQPAPFVTLYGGTATPEDRGLDGTAVRRWRVWRAVCVSNNHDGAVMVAAGAVAAADGLTAAGGTFTAEAVSEPLEDRTDPSQTYWSSTVEFDHHS